MIHYLNKNDLPEDKGFITSKALLLYLNDMESYRVEIGYYNFDTKEFEYNKGMVINEIPQWKVVAWEEIMPKVKEVKIECEAYKMIDWLMLTGGLHLYNDSVDLQSETLFKSKKGKYLYQFITPHEGINNKFMLRMANEKDFDRWSNSTDGQIFFSDLGELMIKFKKGVFGYEEVE